MKSLLTQNLSLSSPLDQIAQCTLTQKFRLISAFILSLVLDLLSTLTLLLTLFSVQTPPSYAFVKCMTQNGTLIHHPTPLHIQLFGQPASHSFPSELELFQATVKSLQRWEDSTQSQFQFDYWQGEDSQSFPATGAQDGKSSLFFISQSKNPSLHPLLSRNTLGITELWYDPRSGQISEFDIILNDIDFEFTTNPSDTSGFGNSRRVLTSPKTPVFIENVITHELGHALGLSHSAALQSTMLFTESPEQAHLGCDDQIGIQTLYPAPQLKETRGTLRGKILTPQGNPILGAHVVALSTHRGTLFSTALTNKEGVYQFESLEPGLYHLFVEPYFAGTNVLPEYYSSNPTPVCKTDLQESPSFARTFFMQNDRFKLKAIEVHANSETSIEDLKVQCQSTIQPQDVQRPSGSAISSSQVEINWQSHDHEKTFSIVYQAQPKSHHLMDLKEISGDLRIHALSYSLYSPLHVNLALKDEKNNEYPAEIKNPIQIAESGLINFDAEVSAKDLPQGRYFLELNYEKLSIRDYPAGPIALDSIPFVVLIGTLNQAPLPLEETLTDHPRCRSPENFPFYQSPPLPQPYIQPSDPYPVSTQDVNSGCNGGFFGETLDPKNSFFHLISWILSFFGSSLILKLFKDLLTQSAVDKLKLWD